MNWLRQIKLWRGEESQPVEHRHGALGERAAREHLRKQGLKYLAANFRSSRGELDLVFWDGDCLVFVEVKTRSSEEWLRPAAYVNARKRRLLSKCAMDYLRQIKTPPVKIRFDVVEVLLRESAVAEVRHLPNCFGLSAPYRYG